MERDRSSSSPRPQSHSHAIGAVVSSGTGPRGTSTSASHHQAHQAHQAQAAATAAAAFNYSAFLNAASVGDSSSVMLSSTENLLRNIQSLLKVAAENARQQDRQANYEKGTRQVPINPSNLLSFPFALLCLFESKGVLSACLTIRSES